MSMLITRTGMLDTLQDIGRFGYGGWGINPSGAMDRFALMASNALVGNALSEAVIEMHFPSPSIKFKSPALISLTGGDFDPNVDGIPVPNWKTIAVAPESTLTFANKKSGFRTYLSVHGGFDIPSWLGSKSTNIKVGRGGFEGRPLRKGDMLSLHMPMSKFTPQVFPWTINHVSIYQSSTIHFVPSAIWNSLSENDQHKITSASMEILPTSDRMGYYFENEPVLLHEREEVLSSAVDFGTIQILPSGKLVCLMADHQTTGGYPRLGSVISADLPKLAQTSPGSTFNLVPSSLDEAEKRLFSQTQNLRLAATAIHEKLKPILHDHRS